MKDKKIFKLLILFCLIFSTSLTYPKISKGNEQTIEKRLNEISNNVRCLVCRNQSIYDSNSDFANDIKKIIMIHLNDNKSDEFIYKFLKSHSIKLDKNFSVIVNQGPGSFSGIRISLAVAKGLVIAKKIRLYGYKNEDLMEFNLKNIEELMKKKLIEKKLIKPIYLS